MKSKVASTIQIELEIVQDLLLCVWNIMQKILGHLNKI